MQYVNCVFRRVATRHLGPADRRRNGDVAALNQLERKINFFA